MLHTYAAGEYCESIVRQRCGCKINSSDAESSSGPYPTPRVEDVHSIGKTCTCARHQQSAAEAQAHFKARKHPCPTPTSAFNDCNTCYAPWPPANIASPSFGSDVAARQHRATLRAAVVHIPLVALKMSTLLPPTPPAQDISNQRRQLKQTSQLASILRPSPNTPPPAINNFNT